MAFEAGQTKWERDGYVILPRFLPASELAPAVADLRLLFPSGDEFHDAHDDVRNARFRDEFGGIDDFPFASVEWSLLAVHDDLVALASVLLGTEDLRVYSIEAWAKYTGAADYDQQHHRDYLSHTLVTPSPDARHRPVEMFVYLVDVTPPLGPPSFVSRRHTVGLPAIPNWFPREDDADPGDAPPSWVSRRGRPEVYDVEVPAVGPAGTVVAYSNDTVHRATAMTAPRGARYTIHTSFRPAAADWIGRHSWPAQSNREAWHRFVARASPRQLSLFGFPPPGHSYWTPETLAATAQRYPGLDVEPWRAHPPPR